MTPIIRLVCKGRDLSSLLAESVKYADRIAGYHKTGELRLWRSAELEAARALVEACVGAPEPAYVPTDKEMTEDAERLLR